MLAGVGPLVNNRSTSCLGIYVFMFYVGRHEPDGLGRLGSWIMANTLIFPRLDSAWSKRPVLDP